MAQIGREAAHGRLLVVGMQQVEPGGFDGGRFGVGGEFAGVPSEHLEVFGAGPEASGLIVVFPGAGVRGADQGLVAFDGGLVLAGEPGQFVRRPLPLGDVRVGALVAEKAALAVHEGNAVGGHPQHIAGTGLDGMLEIEEGAAIGEGGLELLPEGFAPLLGVQIGVRPSRQVVRGAAPDLAGHAGGAGEASVGVEFPGDGPAVARELVVAAHHQSEIGGSLFDELFQVFAPVGDETDNQRAGGGDDQSGE